MRQLCSRYSGILSFIAKYQSFHISGLIFTSIMFYGLLNLVYLSVTLDFCKTQKIVSNFSIGILIANGKCLLGNEEIPNLFTISFLCSKSKLLNCINSRPEREHQCKRHLTFHLVYGVLIVFYKIMNR